MNQKLLRGRLLTFHKEPQSGEDTSAYTYLEDGGLLIEDGIIQDSGSFETLQAQAPDAPVTMTTRALD